MLTDAVRFIRAHDNITLIAHVSPDGDTLGSSLALNSVLKQLGKRTQTVCEEPVPKIYRFLPGWEEVLLPAQARQTEAAISIDCADLGRTGNCEPLFLGAAHTLNIDHHGTNNRYARENYVQRCGATGELIYWVIAHLKVALTKETASCLYTALATDTGNFAYSNTTPDTLRIAAELLETGIDLPYLNRMLFRTVPFQKARLHALAVMKTALYDNGRIAVSQLDRGDIFGCGATGEDCEGIIDAIRDIDTVEIAALLRESADGCVRVSLRGKSEANVGQLAQQFGGGGHRLAAGCTMDLPLTDAAGRILAAAQALLNGEQT